MALRTHKGSAHAYSTGFFDPSASPFSSFSRPHLARSSRPRSTARSGSAGPFSIAFRRFCPSRGAREKSVVKTRQVKSTTRVAFSLRDAWKSTPLVLARNARRFVLPHAADAAGFVPHAASHKHRCQWTLALLSQHLPTDRWTHSCSCRRAPPHSATSRLVALLCWAERWRGFGASCTVRRVHGSLRPHQVTRRCGVRRPRQSRANAAWPAMSRRLAIARTRWTADAPTAVAIGSVAPQTHLRSSSTGTPRAPLRHNTSRLALARPCTRRPERSGSLCADTSLPGGLLRRQRPRPFVRAETCARVTIDGPHQSPRRSPAALVFVRG